MSVLPPKNSRRRGTLTSASFLVVDFFLCFAFLIAPLFYHLISGRFIGEVVIIYKNTRRMSGRSKNSLSSGGNPASRRVFSKINFRKG